MAYGRVTIEELYELTQSLPKEGEPITPKEGEEPSAFYKAYKIVRNRLGKAIGEWEKEVGVYISEKLTM